MSGESSQEPKSVLRNPFFYTAFLIAVALLYVGGIFFSRWMENRSIEERTAEKKREEARRAVESMGGDRLEIQTFYANSGAIHRGETAQICYGVANAKTVRLEPPATQAVWPSYARCVDVAPKRDTTYTLTVEDSKGNTKTATLTLQVR